MPSSPEVNRIKVAGAAYAKRFLALKYSEEYVELYQAYLRNRGIKPRSSQRTPIVDEREILKERSIIEQEGN